MKASSPVATSPAMEQLVQRAQQLCRSGRALLGICGAPGAGKSTLTAELAARLNADSPDAAERPMAIVVGLDGFHLAQNRLDQLGLAEVKGAPHTFDAHGYLQLLRRISTQRDGDPVIYAPEFRRRLEEPIAAAIAVHPGTPLVITEGNYLLLEHQPWDSVAAELSEVWYLQPGEQARRQRLIERHRHFGLSLAQATARADGSDGRNAALVAASVGRADLVVRQP